MKKTLAAVAVLGAFAGSAVAADVTLYGLVDYSVRYQNLDADTAGVDKTNKVDMKSGANSGSRFGLKGTEDLGNGVKVGFVLENGFAADTGALGDKNNRLRPRFLRPRRPACQRQRLLRPARRDGPVLHGLR